MAHPFGPIIHQYTRAQAIADGELVNVTHQARELGIKLPVALTRRVWQDSVAWTDADTRNTGIPQDEHGRLHDVLWLTAQKLRRLPRFTGHTSVELWRVPRNARSTKPRATHLEVVCSPGDNAEPVITIQFPNED